MLKIGKDPRTDQWHALSSYFAMEVVSDLMSNGNAKQRKALMVQLVENDAVSICIDVSTPFNFYFSISQENCAQKLQNHPLIIHRQIAAALLRCFSAESFLGELLTSKETSDLMVILCEHILKGPEMYEKQLGDPNLTWQIFLCFGSFGVRCCSQFVGIRGLRFILGFNSKSLKIRASLLRSFSRKCCLGSHWACGAISPSQPRLLPRDCETQPSPS